MVTSLIDPHAIMILSDIEKWREEWYLWLKSLTTLFLSPLQSHFRKAFLNNNVMLCRIVIPPGSSDGQVLRLDIRPDLMRRAVGQQDHFYVYLKVLPSKHFTRKDADIFSEQDISISQV